ncbi:MAG: hypothetical protein ACRDEA_14545, partial [Microcystaceae cyanobacterium]
LTLLQPNTVRNSHVKYIISWLRRTSLRTKVIALTFLIGNLPVLGFGVVTYYLLNQSTTEEIVIKKQEKARFLTKNISNFMLRRYGDIEILSQSIFLQNHKLR